MESKISHMGFNLKNVVDGTKVLCSENYWQLLGIMFIGMLIGAIPSLCNVLIETFFKGSMLSILLYLVVIVIALVTIYFSVRVNIVLYFSIDDSIHFKERTFSEKYYDAGAVIWNYIGASLLLGLMALAIYFGFAIVMALIGGITAAVGGSKVLLIGLLALCGLAMLGTLMWLMVQFSFAMLVRIFIPNQESYFTYSKTLVDGYSWQVFGIYLIPAAIQLIIVGVSVTLMLTGVINNLVYMGIIYSTFLLMGPLFTTAFVVMFKLLHNEKKAPEAEPLSV